MFVLLTSRPGQFRTEPTDGMTAVEAYDYVFYGKRTARFVIAELAADTKVRVLEETPSGSSTWCRPSSSTSTPRWKPPAPRCANWPASAPWTSRSCPSP